MAHERTLLLVPRPLFLTGMMGSGKSTVGRLLAERTGAHFVDLDVRVERLYGTSVPALLHKGEPEFRRAERRALETLVSEPGFCGRAVVVATGGGVVIDAANRALMRRVGRIVYLDVDVDALADRLAVDEDADPGSRPLLGGSVVELRHRLSELLAARAGAYRDCDVRVDGKGDPEAIAARIEAALGQAPDDTSETEDSEAV